MRAESRPPRQRLVQLLRQAETERITGQQVAMQLMRKVPGWFVMWGSGSRMFHAFPLWSGASRQSSADPDELIGLMCKEHLSPITPKAGGAASSSPTTTAPPRPTPSPRRADL